jgi:ribosomal protein L37E
MSASAEAERRCPCGRPLPRSSHGLCSHCRFPRAKRLPKGRLRRAQRHLRHAVASTALVTRVERELERRDEGGRGAS